MSGSTVYVKPDPLPYIIAFAFLFIIMLGTLTWTLDVWNKANACSGLPGIWCADTWTCNTAAPCGTPTPVNICFNSNGTTGLASCLYGVDSELATRCFTPPTGGTGTSCDCIAPLQASKFNCLAGCGTDFGPSSALGAACCCCPGAPGCTNKIDAMPSQCRGTTGSQIQCNGVPIPL
jgi:hypothetical protein